MKDVLKDGPAEHVIQGLAPTADAYDDAIKCLLNRYNWPHLIHQAPVRAIVDVPSLKGGSGKELRCLHDVLLQNYRAFRAMNEDKFLRLCSLVS